MFISWSLCLLNPQTCGGPSACVTTPKLSRQRAEVSQGSPLLGHCTLLPGDQPLESHVLCVLSLFVLCRKEGKSVLHLLGEK